jgi:hypothetical protein
MYDKIENLKEAKGASGCGFWWRRFARLRIRQHPLCPESTLLIIISTELPVDIIIAAKYVSSLIC